MSIEDSMTIDERRKYLRMMQKRYLQAGQKNGTAVGRDGDDHETGPQEPGPADGGSLERRPRHQQRGRTPGPEIDDALRVIVDG
jgi:hypothetical protein